MTAPAALTASRPAARQADQVLQVSNLTKHFPLPGQYPFAKRRVVHAVEDVSFSLGRGEALGLVGESGSGKTTVALSLVRLVRPTSGSIVFDGTDIAQLPARSVRSFRRRIQLVFQDPYASLNPRLSIQDALMEPILVHRLASDRQGAKARALELLDLVGLPRSAALRYPHEFSGGQRQRVGIARALAVEPQVLIADEPVSALDVSVQAQIIELLDELRKNLSLSILLVSHDLGVVGYMCDRIAVMYLGRIMEIGSAAEIFENPQHPYTRALLSAIPTMASQRRARTVLKGDLPSPVEPPSGCVFRTRCPYALPACGEAVPQLRSVARTQLKACIRDDLGDMER